MIKPTTIAADAVNILAISGLQPGVVATDNVVVADNNGVLKKLDPSVFKTWNLLGNRGTNPALNFLGTTDYQPLKFRIFNTNAGKIDFASTAIGYEALSSIEEYHQGVAFGTGALQNTTTGDFNTAIGVWSLRGNTIGFGNTAVGSYALLNNIDGSDNTALGGSTLANNISGQLNTAIGSKAMYGNESGDNNLALGADALLHNMTGSYNIGVGNNALLMNTTGSQNIGIGYAAGGISVEGGMTGTRNIIIGSTNPVSTGLMVSSGTANNEMNIGNTLFGTSINDDLGTGKIGINNNAPTNTFHVTSTANPVRFEGLTTGLATNNVVVADASGVLKVISPSLISVEPWQVQSTTNKATLNTDPIYQMGKVGINTTNLLGTADSTVWLAVNGAIKTTTATYPDYVFENYYNKTDSSTKNYSFKSLKEIEKFVNENKHLPGVTGIGELSKNEKGDYIFNVTKLSVEVLEKVEELYLHVIEQQKELEAKDKEILILKQKSAEMDSRLERLEKLLVQTSSK